MIWQPALTLALVLACATPLGAVAAEPKSCEQGNSPVSGYRSVEIDTERRATFRLCAPEAKRVILGSSDLTIDVEPGTGAKSKGLELERDPSGLWSGRLATPIDPGAYRYFFMVDGVKALDPTNRDVAQGYGGLESLLDVPGDSKSPQNWNKDVPHGQIAITDYWSTSLGIQRRAHIYLPAGYSKYVKRYPVLYLVHGASGSDQSWSSVGRTGVILDNLIAAGKAVPMIIVMPDGITPFRPGVMTIDNPDFGNDLTKDLIPYIDSQYRTIAKAPFRAMAGQSMGGSHTYRNGLTHPELFRWIGIFSMGLGQINDPNPDRITDYSRKYDALLQRDAKDLSLLYLSMGRDDYLYPTIAKTRAMFDSYHMPYVYKETTGGHTWANWRLNLEDFAQRLFVASKPGS